MAKCNIQHYKLSGPQYATRCILTNHHINYLVLSRLCTPTILNVLNMARVKQSKLHILGNLNEAGTRNNNSGESSFAYFGIGIVLPYTQF